MTDHNIFSDLKLLLTAKVKLVTKISRCTNMINDFRAISYKTFRLHLQSFECINNIVIFSNKKKPTADLARYVFQSLMAGHANCDKLSIFK